MRFKKVSNKCLINQVVILSKQKKQQEELDNGEKMSSPGSASRYITKRIALFLSSR